MAIQLLFDSSKQKSHKDFQCIARDRKRWIPIEIDETIQKIIPTRTILPRKFAFASKATFSRSLCIFKGSLEE